MPQELLIALIAAAAALSGSLLGSFLTRSTEHKQWLRNKKYESYIKFLGLTFSHGTTKPEDWLKLDIDLVLTLNEIRIQAPGEIFLAMAPIYDGILQRIGTPKEGEELITSEDLAKRLSHLTKLLRRDLGVD